MTPPVPADALWSEFALGRDPELWEQLAPEFERLARSVAAVFARSDYEREALFRVALVALVKALDRYRPRPGMSFAHYATPLLLSEIRAHMRSDQTAVELQQSPAMSVGQEMVH